MTGRRLKSEIDAVGMDLRAKLASMPAAAVFTSAEAATYAQVGVSTWERWRMMKRTPPAIRLSQRSLGYRKSALDAWLDARTEKLAA